MSTLTVGYPGQAISRRSSRASIESVSSGRGGESRRIWTSKPAVVNWDQPLDYWYAQSAPGVPLVRFSDLFDSYPTSWRPAKYAGRPWRIYVVSREGGTPREASSGDENQGAPTWSPDGKWLAYANVSCQASHTCAVHRIELATGKTETVPGSGDLRTARWSPDGR